jgi:hypothetical protein
MIHHSEGGRKEERKEKKTGVLKCYSELSMTITNLVLPE